MRRDAASTLSWLRSPKSPGVTTGRGETGEKGKRNLLRSFPLLPLSPFASLHSRIFAIFASFARFAVHLAHKKRRDGASPDIHSYGISRSIMRRHFASISRVQIYQIARFKSSNIFVFRADWVRSRYGVRSCVKKIFRVFWRFPRNEKGPNLDLPNHSYGERS
jgi:hypothetical protein